MTPRGWQERDADPSLSSEVGVVFVLSERFELPIRSRKRDRQAYQERSFGSSKFRSPRKSPMTIQTRTMFRPFRFAQHARVICVVAVFFSLLLLFSARSGAQNLTATLSATISPGARPLRFCDGELYGRSRAVRATADRHNYLLARPEPVGDGKVSGTSSNTAVTAAGPLGGHTVSYSYSGDGSYAGNSATYNFDVLETKFAFVGSAWEVIANDGDQEHSAVDSKDNLYFTDQRDNIKRKLDPRGNITTFYSNGLSTPLGIAIDAADNLYAAD
jgi:hypothetical protein